MSISIVDDIFTQEEIDRVYDVVGRTKPVLDDKLGRLLFCNVLDCLAVETVDKLHKIVKDLTGLPLSIGSAAYTEYNPIYGKPNLQPHLDGDNSDLIINIQLESNTDWPLGLNFETYQLKDNSALIFNQNKEIHWRVRKEFKDGEYVRMLFVRLYNKESPSDYSHLNPGDSDEMFKDTYDFRESLGTF